MARTAELVADGLVFPEGPRWHDNRLWISDQHDRRVVTVTGNGLVETVVEVAGQPSGLGWLPDGRLLVVSMRDRRVLRLESDGLVEHADLGPLVSADCNDMVVDAVGRAYVGNFGFDLYGGERPRDTTIVRVNPDGTAAIAADGLAFPNGSVITPDGGTLLVGESMAGRITAFAIGNDGTLDNRRTWATLTGATVDGMCLDADGCVWVACPGTGRALRVREGGEVVDEIRGSHPGVYACMLGGPEHRTLFLCTAPSHEATVTTARRSGRIEAIVVETPGAGLP